MFRRVAQAQRLVDEAFGRIDASDIADDTANWHLHPALLDGCLQLVSVADGWPGAEPCDPWVPSSVERITLHRAAPGALWCHVRLRARADGSPRLDGRSVDLGRRWRACGQPRRRDVRALPCHRPGIARGWIGGRASGIEITWQRVESPAVTAVPSRWLIVGAGAWAHTLADALRQRGADAEAVPDVRAALNAAHVVHLAPLDLPDEAAAEAALPALQPAIDAALRVVQAVVGATHASPRLWWITRQAQAVRGHETAAPLAATFWGLACCAPNIRSCAAPPSTSMRRVRPRRSPACSSRSTGANRSSLCAKGSYGSRGCGRCPIPRTGNCCRPPVSV